MPSKQAATLAAIHTPLVRMLYVTGHFASTSFAHLLSGSTLAFVSRPSLLPSSIVSPASFDPLFFPFPLPLPLLVCLQLLVAEAGQQQQLVELQFARSLPNHHRVAHAGVGAAGAQGAQEEMHVMLVRGRGWWWGERGRVRGGSGKTGRKGGLGGGEAVV